MDFSTQREDSEDMTENDDPREVLYSIANRVGIAADIDCDFDDDYVTLTMSFGEFRALAARLSEVAP
jgi:hypothetical protein